MIALPSQVNILLIGDSKTVALPNVEDSFFDITHQFNEIDTRISQVGWKADELLLALPDAIAALTGSPDKILINIGANDIAAGRTEENYKTSIRGIIELLHTEFSNALIGIAKPVILAGSPPNTPLEGVDILHGWINTVLSEYSYCFEGVDETGMENGDSYVTYLVDLTHNTAAGKTWMVNSWLTAMGY